MISLRSDGRAFSAAAIGLGAVYPFLVYGFIDRLPPGVFVAAALAIIAARIAAIRGAPWARALTVSLLAAAVVLAGISLIDRMAASRAYPILMSLSAAAVFGHSLLTPPSLIEQIAGRRTALPAAARPYLRKVTTVWFCFLIANAAVSAATAAIGDIALWTLYNGLLSYLLMGALFIGEMLVRPRAQRSAAGPV